MVFNRQSRVAVSLPAVRAFIGRLQSALGLERREFNVCFVNDREIRRFNARYRGQRKPTDVLSFPWGEGSPSPDNGRELKNFLGDVVISAETAERNARARRHAVAQEIRWLILHGVLHLLGYDHETDAGRMTVLELSLRERLGTNGRKVSGTSGRAGGRKRR